MKIYVYKLVANDETEYAYVCHKDDHIAFCANNMDNGSYDGRASGCEDWAREMGFELYVAETNINPHDNLPYEKVV